MGLNINQAGLQLALSRSPQILTRHLSPAIDRVLLTFQRSAKAYAPKAFSTLAQSVQIHRLGPLAGQVRVASDYGPMVEFGTGPQGPAARSSHKAPPVSRILDWVKLRRIQPHDPGMDQADLAFAIARSIAVKGTPAKPFLSPAFDDDKSQAEQRLNKAIDAALAEMGK